MSSNEKLTVAQERARRMFRTLTPKHRARLLTEAILRARTRRRLARAAQIKGRTS